MFEEHERALERGRKFGAVLALALLCGCAAAVVEAAPPGVPAVDAPVRAPVPPAAPAEGPCPNPSCRSTGEPKPRAGTEASAEEKECAKVAEIRGPGSVMLEAKPDSPVRGVLVSNGGRILVEVRLLELAAPREKRPGLARFSLRLRDEDETVQVEELRPSRRPGGHYDAVPEGWSGDAVSGVPFFRYFARSGGTAWEIDGILDVLDGGGVRFTLRPTFQVCTK